MVPILVFGDAILDFAIIPFVGMSCERSFRQKEWLPTGHFVQLGTMLVTLDAFLVTFGATWVTFQGSEISKSDHVGQGGRGNYIIFIIFYVIYPKPKSLP